MILPKREDTLHKIQLLRLLQEIVDDTLLSQNVFFKGGTCAAMLGYLDRFSLDLDFDLSERTDKKIFDKKLREIFDRLNLEVKQKSKNELFYILKYQAETGIRNTIKLGIVDKQAKANIYKPIYLGELDRFVICQTKETMFSYKLISLTDRYKKYKTIAGRDLYDIHHFFLKGFRYIEAIIKARSGKKTLAYLQELREFIKSKITNEVISEDLNYLLPTDRFQAIRKILKKETILLLGDEIKRLENI